MSSIEEKFQAACDSRELPGVILLASDASGKFQYQKAFGPKSPTEPMDMDTMFIFASCTKLMTAISALQCVERGQIGLDDDVSQVLTELKDVQILKDFPEGTEEPTYEKPKTKITLRMLLTHTSGLGYDAMNPKYTPWRKSRGEVPGVRGMPMLQRFGIPLLFEPGTSWEYGCGMDWAGMLVSRLNNLSLEAYMQKHIWDPLDIQNITFHPDKKPEVLKRLVKISVRGGIENPMLNLPTDTGKKVEWTDELLYDLPTTDECGGQGSYGSPVSYMKIMQSILSDDGKLLQSETIDEMCRPQLGPSARKAYEEFIGAPYSKDMFASHKPGTKASWGLGSMLILQDEETGRKSGTLSWSGLPNLLWTIDRATGLNLMYASNLVPFGDFPSAKMQVLFETEMYKRFAEASHKL